MHSKELSNEGTLHDPVTNLTLGRSLPSDFLEYPTESYKTKVIPINVPEGYLSADHSYGVDSRNRQGYPNSEQRRKSFEHLSLCDDDVVERSNDNIIKLDDSSADDGSFGSGERNSVFISTTHDGRSEEVNGCSSD